MPFTNSTDLIDPMLPPGGMGQNSTIILTLGLFAFVGCVILVDFFRSDKRLTGCFHPLSWLLILGTSIGIIAAGVHLKSLIEHGWTLSWLGMSLQYFSLAILPKMFLVLFIFAIFDTCFWILHLGEKKKKKTKR